MSETDRGRGRGRGGERGRGRGRGGGEGGRGRGRGRGRGGEHNQQQQHHPRGEHQEGGHRGRGRGSAPRGGGHTRPHTDVNFFIVRKSLRGHDAKPTAAVPTDIPAEVTDNAGKEFYGKLKAFVQDPNQVVYDFPNSLKLSQRQKVHSLAEQFALDHFSRGSNPFRYICVQKRGVKQPDEWQYFGYIGLFGSSIDTIASNYVRKHGIDRLHIRKRIKRDGPIHHVTLMTRPEINSALKNLESIKEYESFFDREKLEKGTEQERIDVLLTVIGQVVKDDFVPLGLGKTSQEDNVAYFVVINWHSAQELRKKLGLEPYHFHTTVAFKSNDIHGVAKDKSTLLEETAVESQQELAAIKRDHVAEMATFLKHLGISERFAHTFVTTGDMGVDTLKGVNEMDLFDLGIDNADDQKKILDFLADFDTNIKKLQQ